ncbi:S8 family serine peptidase [Hydrogenophaga sp.]|uniref:S8 family peptidase n=1 Tax=Hydrogenophaga sp. TaxID=1904254 RepID=UPI002639A4EF|nr:S8 family serine peptidase [Hydrogenophaga sp.]MCW5654982.1 S8 family peptidase [Hydrogenophaga sp.]
MNRLLSVSLSLAMLACLGLSTAQAGTPQTAMGLIIGLRDANEPSAEMARTADRGPWVSERERSRAQWERGARRDRERVARAAQEAGVALAGTGGAGNASLMRFDRPLRGEALERAMRRMRLHPDVAWVEPDVLVPRLAAVVPDDLLFSQQWHLQAPDGGSNLSGLNLPAAWGNTTGSSVVVAVVDSGVRFDHPELQALGPRLLAGYDMISDLSISNDDHGRDADASDPGDWVTAGEVQTPTFAGCEVSDSNWHGTFIAGQIAAATQNAQGVAGLNWNARLLPVRVSGKCGAMVSDLLDGLRWAAGLPVWGVPGNPNPARVINLSFGGDQPCSQAYQNTIDAVTNAGSLVVVAAGNNDASLFRPADCRRVMTVASVRKDGAKASYSSFGSRVSLAAPGGSVEGGNATMLLSIDNSGTTTPQLNGYGHKQGTSFAAPQASGVASLMLAVNPALSPRQLIERMRAGARPHVSLGGLAACGPAGAGVCNCTTSTCGAGLLDAHTAVQLATGPAVVIQPVGDVEPGTVVRLDGSGSVAIPGASIVSYQWVQVSGPSVAITAADTAVATVTLASEAEYVFSLTVVDNVNRHGEDTVRITAAMPAATVAGGGGGGSMRLLWGAALWAWVLAVIASQRRNAVPVSARRA